MPRKYWQPPRQRATGSTRFNEAGADAPEIQVGLRRPLSAPHRFNEAGADAPEIRGLGQQFRRGGDASMRPGRMPRKYDQTPHGDVVMGEASMRPGRMPRKYRATTIQPGLCADASMRPGRMPRKYPARPERQ